MSAIAASISSRRDQRQRRNHFLGEARKAPQCDRRRHWVRPTDWAQPRCSKASTTSEIVCLERPVDFGKFSSRNRAVVQKSLEDRTLRKLPRNTKLRSLRRHCSLFLSSVCVRTIRHPAGCQARPRGFVRCRRWVLSGVSPSCPAVWYRRARADPDLDVLGLAKRHQTLRAKLPAQSG